MQGRTHRWVSKFFTMWLRSCGISFSFSFLQDAGPVPALGPLCSRGKAAPFTSPLWECWVAAGLLRERRRNSSWLKTKYLSINSHVIRHIAGVRFPLFLSHFTSWTPKLAGWLQ